MPVDTNNAAGDLHTLTGGKSNLTSWGSHFHLLVKVPKAPSEPLAEHQLLRRLETLSGLIDAGTLLQRLENFRALGQHEAAQALRQCILVRIHDLSAFVKPPNNASWLATDAPQGYLFRNMAELNLTQTVPLTRTDEVFSGLRERE